MPNSRLTLAYDGTSFHGWQVQPGQRTVQGVIEEHLTRILQEKVRVHGAARTDAGAHALGQVANFRSEKLFPSPALKRALSHLFPGDIGLRDCEQVPEGFHARHSARARIYEYRILNSSQPSPFQRHYSYFCPFALDRAAIKEAASYLVGTHDFTSFSKAGSVGVPQRHLERLDLREQDKNITLEFEANSFLYGMIRLMVGALLEVGRGKRKPQELREILAAKRRGLATSMVPAGGLYLVKVRY